MSNPNGEGVNTTETGDETHSLTGHEAGLQGSLRAPSHRFYTWLYVDPSNKLHSTKFWQTFCFDNFRKIGSFSRCPIKKAVHCMQLLLEPCPVLLILFPILASWQIVKMFSEFCKSIHDFFFSLCIELSLRPLWFFACDEH